MKVLLLGSEKHSNIFNTFEKILELENINSEILYFENCTEKNFINTLKSSEMFLFYPEEFCKSASNDKQGSMYEFVSAGYALANKGRVLIFAPEPELLNGIFYGEPSVRSIGEALGHFRRERKNFEKNKFLVEARELISKADLSFSNKGFTEAVQNGMYKEAQAFLVAGFTPETENDKGVPLLSLAVRNNDMDMCRLLLSYKAAPNIIARDRVSSPAMDAVVAENQEIAELLIDVGADLNFKNRNGQTLLVVAIGARMEKISKLLIEKGADVTIKDSLGMTAAQYAKLFSLTELQELIESKM